MKEMKAESKIKGCIAKVTERGDLTPEESEDLMQRILAGELTSAQLASVITALKMKGETVEEITGFARAMREKSKKIELSNPKSENDNDNYNKTEISREIIDTCGTGGDSSSSFNISTATALVASGCGLKVAKHGNRAVSSSCGSADILETLGIDISTSPDQVKKSIEEVGFGFLYAPLHHEAMKHAKEPRQEMGVKTIFNLLGPLTNPAGAKRQLIGVYHEKLTGIMAEVLKELGGEKAWVVHGLDGMDEITLCDKTKVTELDRGRIREFYLDPRDYGFETVSKRELEGGDKNHNTEIILDIIKGKKGPCRDVVVLNAAACLLIADKVRDLKEGVELVSKRLDEGKPMKKLETLRELTRERGVV